MTIGVICTIISLVALIVNSILVLTCCAAARNSDEQMNKMMREVEYDMKQRHFKEKRDNERT